MSDTEADVEMTYSADQVQQLLRCPVCLDRFTNPKILPCQHTFCSSPCVEGLIDHRNRTIKCPECRKEHMVPHGGARAFPTNITIANFLDLPAQRTASVREVENNDRPTAGNAHQCGVCETDAETVKCFHCNKMVCASCKRSHTGQMRLDISRLVSQVRRGIPKFSTAISLVEQKTEEMKQVAESLKSDVREVLEQKVREFKERERMLQSEVDTYLQGELRSLRLHQENIEVELASITSYCDSTESLLSQADLEMPEADLVSLRRQCGEYLEQTRNAESENLPSNRVARFKHNGENLTRNIRSFGEIQVHNSLPASSSQSQEAILHQSEERSDGTRQRWEDVPPLDVAFFESLNDVQPPPSSTRLSLSPPAQWQDTHDPPFPHRPPRSSSDTGTHSPYLGYTGSIHAVDSVPQPDSHRSQQSSRYMYHMGLLDDFEQARRTRARNNTSTVFGPDLRTSGMMSLGFTVPSAMEESYLDSHGNYNNNTNNENSNRHRGNRQTLGATVRTQQHHSAPVLRDPRPAEAYELDGEGNLRIDTLDSSIRQPPPHVLARQQRFLNRDNEETNNMTGFSQSQPPPTQEPAIHQTPEMMETGEELASDGDTPASPTSNHSNHTANVRRGPVREGQGTGTTHVRRTNSDSSHSNPRLNRPRRSRSNDRPRVQRDRDAVQNAPRLSTALPVPPPDGPANQLSSSSSDDDIVISVPRSNRLQRAGTFVQQNGPLVGASSVPHVRDGAVSFHVPVNTDRQHTDDPQQRIQNVTVSLTTDSPANNYLRKGAPLRFIGNGRGSTRGKFKSPRGVAVTRDDRIVVADSSNHRVQVFNPDGSLDRIFGSYGDCNGEFDCLSGVAVSSSGNIIIADRYNHRIQKFTMQGGFVRSFGVEGNINGRFSYPWGVAVDSSDYIYVCDKDNHRIQVFRPDGTFVRKFGSLGSDPGQFENPNYIAITPDDKVVVSDTGNNRIQIFTNQGRLVKGFGLQGTENGKFKTPRGVLVDHEGFILVVDSGNKRVQVFREDGRYFCKFGGETSLNDPEGIALTSQGQVIVADKDNHRVCIF